MKLQIPIVIMLFFALLTTPPSSAQGPVIDPQIVEVVRNISPERLHEYLEVLTDFQTRHSLSLSDRPDWGISPAREYILRTMQSFSDRLQVDFDCYQVEPQGTDRSRSGTLQCGRHTAW